MKVLARPIDVIAYCEHTGKTKPIRFRMKGKDDTYKVIRVDRIVETQTERLAGNDMLVYRCQSIINGVEKVYELKFELWTNKWMLFKIG